jgi:glycosyltransferase involved in cell wall biosynthesis
MKIGLISYHFPPENSAAAIRMGPFVEAWAEAGDTVHVFTHRRMQSDNSSVEDLENVSVHRTAVGTVDNTRSLPVRFLSELAFCLSVIRAVYRSPVDVLVCTSPPFLVAATTLVLSKLTSTPYVLDVRDPFLEVLFAAKVVDRNRLFGRFLKWLERHLYDHALFITSVTEGFVSHIEARTDNDVVLIRNGIDTRRFARSPSSTLRFSAPESEFVVLFHGTLGRFQNIDLLLRYARYLEDNDVRDVCLQIVGDGPKADHLRKKIAEHGLDGRINFLGRVDFEEIPNYINDADVGLSPRIKGFVSETAFPVKVYECLGCGVPVVVTPKGDAGQYVEQHQVGFQHSNHDIEAIHGSIRRLKEDAELYRAYSDRAIRVAKTFDRHELGSRLRDEIAARICNRPGSTNGKEKCG